MKPIPRGERRFVTVEDAQEFMAVDAVTIERLNGTIGKLFHDLQRARTSAYKNHQKAERLARELAKAKVTNLEWLIENGPGGWIDDLRVENEALRAENTMLLCHLEPSRVAEMQALQAEVERLKQALRLARTDFCRISLSSVNSMSTKAEGGRIASAAIKAIDATAQDTPSGSAYNTHE